MTKRLQFTSRNKPDVTPVFAPRPRALRPVPTPASAAVAAARMAFLRAKAAGDRDAMHRAADAWLDAEHDDDEGPGAA